MPGAGEPAQKGALGCYRVVLTNLPIPLVVFLSFTATVVLEEDLSISEKNVPDALLVDAYPYPCLVSELDPVV